MKAARTLLALALIAPLACSRGGAIESEPGPVYLVAVDNPMAHAMDVWYDDGRESTHLGRVEAGATREFVIAAPESASVEIVARDADNTHTVTLPIVLIERGTTRVVLTP